jgi:hypothetical protein
MPYIEAPVRAVLTSFKEEPARKLRRLASGIPVLNISQLRQLGRELIKTNRHPVLVELIRVEIATRTLAYCRRGSRMAASGIVELQLQRYQRMELGPEGEKCGQDVAADGGEAVEAGVAARADGN